MFLEVDRVEGLRSTKKSQFRERFYQKHLTFFTWRSHTRPPIPAGPTPTTHPDPAPRFMCPLFEPIYVICFCKIPPVQPTNDPPVTSRDDASVSFSQAEQTTAGGLYAIVSWRRRPARIPHTHTSCARGSFSHHNHLRPPYLPARRSPAGQCPSSGSRRDIDKERESHRQRCTEPTCSALTTHWRGSYHHLAPAAAHGKCGDGANHGCDDGGPLQIRRPRARIYAEKCQTVRGRLGSFGVAGGALAARVQLRRKNGRRAGAPTRWCSGAVR
jgi:hypothetical protein